MQLFLTLFEPCLQWFYHCYCFSDKGAKMSILLVQLRKRLYGPPGFGLFRKRPDEQFLPNSPFEKACLKVEKAMDEAVALLAA
jgi:hypothetical protein